MVELGVRGVLADLAENGDEVLQDRRVDRRKALTSSDDNAHDGCAMVTLMESARHAQNVQTGRSCQRTLHQVLVGSDLLRRRSALDDLEQRQQNALGMVADVGLVKPARSRGVSRSAQPAGTGEESTHMNEPFCLIKRIRSIVKAA